MKVQFEFKGLMVPVFTPFNDDKKRSINYDMIDKYVQLLKQKGMHGVMVNGMTGEGMTLRIDERKRLAEEWMKATRKHQLVMMLNIGGAPVADVWDMAEHAEKLAVDAILVLPDLFYWPRSEEDLVNYMRDIAVYSPSRPMMYYHIPMMTGVRLPMWRLAEMAEKEIPSFAGVFYADGNLDKAAEMMKSGRSLIMGMGSIMVGAMAMGIDAISMTAMNLMPEMMVELMDHVLNNRLREAMLLQEKMRQSIRGVWQYGDDMIMKMKMEFNKMNSSIKLGPCRKPPMTMMMKPMRRM